ncbi:jacalin-related lectin 24 [Eutrema salsugineum]|uniref:jacalin-related lectin 24 n=1 Tax=Eutrema salsugineum TaxID=72664 RepID=UPI000CED0B1F|nr:jacalin-related lectin 24 [Eutrema salsugineum]
MKMFKVGPIGKKDSKDKSWTEKEYTNISNIYIYFDDYGINSIQFSFSHKGTQVLSQKYGLFTGHYFQIVRLEKDEYLTALSGDCNMSITSLTFHTNKRKHGPFCKRSGSLKSSKMEIDVGISDRSEFGGLFGTFSDYGGDGGDLISIGMYVLLPKLSPIPRTIITHNRTLGYQSPKIVDGFPVKPNRRYKPKLKDRILSMLGKALRFLTNL